MRPDFKVEIARKRAERASRRQELVDAFADSPAVIARYQDARDDQLLILSGDMRRGHGFRVSFMGPDGPWTHVEGDTPEEAIDEAHETLSATWTDLGPASDDDVMEWTSKPEFVEGSQRVAFVQGINELMYICGSQVELAQELKRDAEDAIDRDGWPAALEILEEGLVEARRLCA